MNIIVQDKRAIFRQQFKKRCFEFSVAILQLAETLKDNRTLRPVSDQLIRSGTSIGANVVEGGNSSSKKEFINYFQIALKSSSETLYWLSLIKAFNTNSATVNELINECIQLKKIISTIILNTKSNSKF